MQIHPTLAIVILFLHSHLCQASTIGIFTTSNLSFGKFAAGTGGSVIISAAGMRSKSGGVALFSSANGSAAHFHVTGNSAAIFSVTLPGNNEVLLTSGEQSMSIVNFTVNPQCSGVLDNNGNQVLSVGATLHVDSNKQAGNYSGTFNVIVNYQ